MSIFLLGIYQCTNQTKKTCPVELTFWWKQTDSKQIISINAVLCCKAKGLRGKKIKQGKGIYNVGQRHDFNWGGQDIHCCGDIQEKTQK